jgi:hypothetical protein
MTERSDNIAIQFRCDAEYEERVDRHASSDAFGGKKAHFAKYACTTIMNLRDALGPRFDLEVARLLASADAEQKDGVAA